MQARMHLTPEAQSARQARRFVDGSLQGWDGMEARQCAVLLVNELVVNAIQHAGTPVEVRVALGAAIIEISVRDGSPRMPELRQPDLHEERGRGLIAVDALADEWGVEPEPSGKAVWFRLSSRPSKSHELG